MFLAVFDNIFIFCSILEAIRKHFGPLHDVIHVYAFAYFLYQLQSMAIVSSIFTTVVLAVERCLAVAKPIEYHNAIQGFINTSLENKTFVWFILLGSKITYLMMTLALVKSSTSK